MKKAAIVVVVILLLICGVGGMALKQMQAAKQTQTAANANISTVSKGDLSLKVVDTGTIDAVNAVEVRSRASGQLKKLYVTEGQMVHEGDLIAIIDPVETQLKVDQDRATLQGAEAVYQRSAIEIAQRRKTAKAAYDQAVVHLAQLRLELQAQPTLTSTAIESARASLSTAKNEKQRLIDTAQPNEKVATESAVREAEANYRNAQSDNARMEQLVGKGYVSTKAAEDARLSIDLAKTRLETAQNNKEHLDAQLKAELSKADDAIRSAQADLDRALANRIQNTTKRQDYESAISDVEKARAALQDVPIMEKNRIQSGATVKQLASVLTDSQRQLQYTKVTAPISGIVSQKLIQEGELVTALSAFSAGTPIVRIEDRGSLRVKLDINEIDVARLTNDLTASIEVDAIPDTVFTGKVRKIAPASDSIATQAAAQSSATPTTNTDSVVKYQVEIWLDAPDNRLRSGMSAKCTLEVAKRTNVLELPLEFVGKDVKTGERYVQLTKANAKPEEKPTRTTIKTGLATGSMIEIVSGLKEGDVVARPDYTGPKRKGFMQAGPDD